MSRQLLVSYIHTNAQLLIHINKSATHLQLLFSRKMPQHKRHNVFGKLREFTWAGADI
jgi:hypothetical protein